MYRVAEKVIFQKQSKTGWYQSGIKQLVSNEDVMDENYFKMGKKKWVGSSSDTDVRHPITTHSQDAI